MFKVLLFKFRRHLCKGLCNLYNADYLYNMAGPSLALVTSAADARTSIFVARKSEATKRPLRNSGSTLKVFSIGE